MSLRNLAVALTIVCGCALALIGEEAKPGRKVAFLVGVGDYKHESRENQLGAPPVNDVREMKKVLEAAGFQVVMLTDDEATQAKVVAAFDLLLDGKLKASDSKNTLGNRDLLLVQLCGHGIQVDATDPEDPGSYAKSAPHAWGLSDMSGNVWEWSDILFSSEQIVRGGSWGTHSGSCRGANRNYSAPVNRTNDIGFRVLLD